MAAVEVVGKYQLVLPETTVQDFLALAQKAHEASVEAMDTEALLGDIPDEFLDPIQVGPVFLLLLQQHGKGNSFPLSAYLS